MNSKQELITFIGIGLILLTIWQFWREDIKAVLFDAIPNAVADIPRTASGDPLTDQFGNSDANGGFSQSTGSLGGKLDSGAVATIPNIPNDPYLPVKENPSPSSGQTSSSIWNGAPITIPFF